MRGINKLGLFLLLCPISSAAKQADVPGQDCAEGIIQLLEAPTGPSRKELVYGSRKSLAFTPDKAVDAAMGGTEAKVKRLLQSFEEGLKTVDDRSDYADLVRVAKLHSELMLAASEHLEAMGISHKLISEGTAVVDGLEGMIDREPSPNRLKIRISNQGKALFNRFAKGMEEKYGSLVHYDPLALRDFQTLFERKLNDDAKGIADLLLSHGALLEGTPKRIDVVHEFVHAKKRMRRRQGIPSSTYGTAIAQADAKLPGDFSDGYDRLVGFDEPEAHRTGISRRLDRLRQRVKMGEALSQEDIASLSEDCTLYENVTSRIQQVVENWKVAGALKVEFKTTDRETLAFVSLSKGVIVEIPLVGLTSMDPGRREKALRELLTQLEAEMAQERQIAKQWRELAARLKSESREGQKDTLARFSR